MSNEAAWYAGYDNGKRDALRKDWITCPTCNGRGDLPKRTAHGRIIRDAAPDRCPDCVGGLVPSPELVERSRFPVLDSIGMIASKWLRITHDEAMQRPDIQEAATIIAKAVLLASRRGEQ